MSNPSSWPEAGSRKPNRKVFWSTPTMSRPRSWMAAIVEPGGMAPGDGYRSGPQAGFGVIAAALSPRPAPS